MTVLLTKPSASLRPLLISVSLALGFYFSGCVQSQFHHPPIVRESTPSATDKQNPDKRININTASADELEKLPGIGRALAARIIEHREKYGSFRKPEHLIIVRGISDKRFRALRELITVE